MRSAVAVLLLCPFHASFAQMSPQWKFREGMSFTLERIFQQKQAVELGGKTIRQDSTVTWKTRIDVRKVSDKAIVIDLTITSVTSLPAGKGLIDQLAEKMKGCKMQITVSPAGRIRAFEGYGDFVKKLAGGNDDLEKTVRFLLPEVLLRDGLEEALGVLPETPVPVGGRWQREAVESIVPFGSFKTRFEYTYEGRRKEGDAIGCKLQSTYVLPKHDLGLIRVVQGKLQADDGKGLVFFDAQRGLLIRGERTMHIHGTLTVATPGRKMNELKFDSENKLSWRLLER